MTISDQLTYVVRTTPRICGASCFMCTLDALYCIDMKKQLIILGILLCAAAVIAYFLIAKPAEAPTGETTHSTSSGNTPATPASTTYTNSVYGFTLQYPSDVTESSSFERTYLAEGDWSLFAQGTHASGTPIASFRLPHSNEIESGELRIGVSSSSGAVAACLEAPKDLGVSAPSKISVNGVPFTLFTMADAAMSHSLSAHIYRTIANGACYSFEEVVMGTNPEVYSPPREAPFTEAQAFSALEEVLQSFTFVHNTPTN